MQYKYKRGFTLIELLITIGILAIISTATILVINPVEIFKQGRDAMRINDMAVLNKALNIYNVVNATGFGATYTIYTSLPDNASPTCFSHQLPYLATGWSYTCKTEANFRKVNGNGWIPVNLTQASVVPPLSALPIDPVNTATSGYYYTYVTGVGAVTFVTGGSWTLSSQLESEKYLRERAFTDGGTDYGRFEIGNNFNLWSQASGLTGYWKFDEVSGATSFSDSSGGDGYSATCVSVCPTAGIGGKVSGAVRFNGINTGARTNTEPPTNMFSVAFWMRMTALPDSDWDRIVDQASAGPVNGFSFSFGSAGSADRDTVRFATYDGVGTTASIKTGALTPGQWYFLVGTFLITGSGQAKLYVNGSEAGADYTTSIGSPSSSFTIGKRYFSSSNYFDGDLDELRVYDRVLTAVEVQALYNATK